MDFNDNMNKKYDEWNICKLGSLNLFRLHLVFLLLWICHISENVDGAVRQLDMLALVGTCQSVPSAPCPYTMVNDSVILSMRDNNEMKLWRQ